MIVAPQYLELTRTLEEVVEEEEEVELQPAGELVRTPVMTRDPPQDPSPVSVVSLLAVCPH